MYVIDVIPIVKTVGKETLTYFTAEKVTAGMLVSVPLRSRKILGLVTGIEDVRAARSRIRTLAHELRRVEKLEAASFLLPVFIAAAERVARLAATTTGSVICGIVPRLILENARDVTRQPSRDRARDTPDAQSLTGRGSVPAALEPELVQAGEEERMALYRRLIRETFAEGKSVLVLAPTIYLASRLAQTLAKGIEQYTVLIHGELKPPSSLIPLWQRALAEQHPLLIVGTGVALSLARRDIAAYILEEEHSKSYKHIARPFLDIRSVVAEVSRAARARYILGSSVLRAETLSRVETGEAHALAPLTLRPSTGAEVVFVDMTKKKDLAASLLPHGTNFSTPSTLPSASRVTDEDKRKSRAARAMLSERARALIRESAENAERVFVFAARRGLAPVTICGDCEHVVLCRICRAALVLHSAPRRNIFRCHRCGAERDALETCIQCGGWKLVALGVGTERIENEIRALVPNTPLTRVDSDSTPTPKKAEKATKSFLDSVSGILVSTEMALPYLDKNIEHVIVSSIDALLALPDFRMNERVFHLLLTLRQRALKTFLLQTRSASHRLFRQALTGHISDFIRDELAERKQFGYPPFTTLVKISRTGTDAQVTKEMENLRVALAQYAPIVYPAPRDTSVGKAQMHALLKIPRDRWPDETLLRLLSTLSPAFAIDVNPESVL